MVAAVRRMPAPKRSQYSRLVGVRALTGCTKSIVELVSADLFLQLNGMDYARTARIVAALTSINTVSDFAFNPVMGALLDAYGRKKSLLAAQVLDGATALLVGLRPSVPNFVVWQLLREFSRRANKPARLAMMGDFVGRASADFVHLYNFSEVCSCCGWLLLLPLLCCHHTSIGAATAAACLTAPLTACLAVCVLRMLRRRYRRPRDWSQCSWSLGVSVILRTWDFSVLPCAPLGRSCSH